MKAASDSVADTFANARQIALVLAQHAGGHGFDVAAQHFGEQRVPDDRIPATAE